MSYDEDEFVGEETTFKLNDNDDEIYDDAFDEPLDPIEEDNRFNEEEEEPETI